MLSWIAKVTGGVFALLFLIAFVAFVGGMKVATDKYRKEFAEHKCSCKQ